MAEFPRLRDYADGDVGELLRTARSDAPRDAAESKRRLLVGLAALETSAVSASASPSEPAVARRLPRVLLGAVVLGAGAMLISLTSSSRSTTPSPVAVATVASAAPHAVPESAPEPRVASMPSIDVSSLPVASAAAGHKAVVRSTPKETEPLAVKAPVADELAAVERVRTELATGDVEGARRDLGDYRVRFGNGRFVEEMDALEVEILAARGERDAARAKAAEFAARYPSSTYARRVRSATSPHDTTEAP